MARSPIPQLPGYHGLVLDAEQLAAHPCLPGLQALLNDSFNHRNMPMSPSATQGRFGELSAITSNFGFHGRCSVIFKCTRQALENGIDEAIPEVVSSSGDEKNGCDCGLRATQPIATAMMKYFNPEINGKAFDGPDIGEGIGYSSEPEDILSISHWEPSCVAISLSDPSLQGKGLAVHCTRLLELDLLDRLELAQEQQNIAHNDDRPHSTTSRGPITLWIRTIAETTGDYWMRRGYQLVGSRMYPSNTWRIGKNFKISTMTKILSRDY